MILIGIGFRDMQVSVGRNWQGNQTAVVFGIVSVSPFKHGLKNEPLEYP
jgi:hypothetical protein